MPRGEIQNPPTRNCSKVLHSKKRRNCISRICGGQLPDGRAKLRTRRWSGDGRQPAQLPLPLFGWLWKYRSVCHDYCSFLSKASTINHVDWSTLIILNTWRISSRPNSIRVFAMMRDAIAPMPPPVVCSWVECHGRCLLFLHDAVLNLFCLKV